MGEPVRFEPPSNADLALHIISMVAETECCMWQAQPQEELDQIYQTVKPLFPPQGQTVKENKEARSYND